MKITIYPLIAEKLKRKHRVAEAEVEQAFLNRELPLAQEVRAENQGELPRYWFIAETDAGRQLKVVFLNDPEEGIIVITAYPPNAVEVRLYEKLVKKT